MTPKEIAATFQETFGLDFHDFYDVESWRTEKEIKLDMFKFDEWLTKSFGGDDRSLKERIEYQYGHKAAEFILSIL